MGCHNSPSFTAQHPHQPIVHEVQSTPHVFPLKIDNDIVRKIRLIQSKVITLEEGEGGGGGVE